MNSQNEYAVLSGIGLYFLARFSLPLGKQKGSNMVKTNPLAQFLITKIRKEECNEGKEKVHFTCSVVHFNLILDQPL